MPHFFLRGEFKTLACDNVQVYDFEGLKGRLLSSSYAPEPGHPQYEPMIEEVKQVFERYQANNQVVLNYVTRMYIGRLK